MNWAQIREQHPHQWVVIEALNATTQGAQRIIDQLGFIGTFENCGNAWEVYNSLHHADKWREYYVFHTDRVELNIGVIAFLGTRYFLDHDPNSSMR